MIVILRLLASNASQRIKNIAFVLKAIGKPISSHPQRNNAMDIGLVIARSASAARQDEAIQQSCCMKHGLPRKSFRFARNDAEGLRRVAVRGEERGHFAQHGFAQLINIVDRHGMAVITADIMADADRQ